MSRHQISQRTNEPDFSSINVLGLVLFLLGAPRGTASMGQASEAVPAAGIQYAMVVVLAGVLAGLLEISLHLGAIHLG